MGNIDSTPLFVDPDGADDLIGTADDNFRLRRGSPCLDAGDNTLVPTDAADLDADGDTGERIPWDTNGQLRFQDDAETTDTGIADLPDYPMIVDLGACEGAGLMLLVSATEVLVARGQHRLVRPHVERTTPGRGQRERRPGLG